MPTRPHPQPLTLFPTSDFPEYSRERMCLLCTYHHPKFNSQHHQEWALNIEHGPKSTNSPPKKEIFPSKFSSAQWLFSPTFMARPSVFWIPSLHLGMSPSCKFPLSSNVSLFGSLFCPHNFIHGYISLVPVPAFWWAASVLCWYLQL